MARYYPQIFDRPDLKGAKEIILTNEGVGADTETRWALETPFVLSLVQETLALRPDMLVLDYGCGVGRMAKAMIDATGCTVIGLDISPEMRRLAKDYVNSERFLALSPLQFDTLVARGLRVDAAISVWVLQHCFAPADDIARMRGSLAAGGACLILNMHKRAVPATVEAGTDAPKFVWAVDNTDVASLLRGAFSVEAEGCPQQEGLPNMADAGAYWMKLRVP